MNCMDYMKRELLRLAGAHSSPTSLSTRRISAFYNISEKLVRQELTKLAEEKKISLSAWDGRSLKPYRAWGTAEEFVESTYGEGQVHIGLCPAEEAPIAKAATAS